MARPDAEGRPRVHSLTHSGPCAIPWMRRSTKQSDRPLTAPTRIATVSSQSRYTLTSTQHCCDAAATPIPCTHLTTTPSSICVTNRHCINLTHSAWQNTTATSSVVAGSRGAIATSRSFPKPAHVTWTVRSAAKNREWPLVNPENKKSRQQSSEIIEGFETQMWSRWNGQSYGRLSRPGEIAV
jgi:hypothetical protein